MKSTMHSYYKRMQIWVDVWLYPGLLALLAFADVFVFVIPSDGILVSSILLRPKKWLRFAMAMTIGSVVAGTLFGYLVEQHGLELIIQWMPALTESWIWKVTENFFSLHGMLVLFLAAASPISFQPAVFFAIVAHTPLIQVFLLLVIGRCLKNLVLGGIASKAPKHLSKLWGIRSDLEEVGSPSDRS